MTTVSSNSSISWPGAAAVVGTVVSILTFFSSYVGHKKPKFTSEELEERIRKLEDANEQINLKIEKLNDDLSMLREEQLENKKILNDTLERIESRLEKLLDYIISIKEEKN